MAKRKRRSIQTLRKAHIWPSIVFVILSLVLVAVFAVAFAAIVLAFVAQDRVESLVKNTTNIIGMFEASDDNENVIIDSLRGGKDAPEAVILLDENGNTIAGYGDATFDIDIESHVIFEYEDGKVMRAYNDTTNDQNILNENGDLDIGVVVISVHTPDEGFFNNDFFVDNTVVSSGFFWLGTVLEDGNNLMVRCRLDLYVKDIAMILVTLMMLGCAMLLPIIFLFANVIISFVNQRRLTTLLYTDTTTEGSSRMYFRHAADKALMSRMNNTKLMAVVDITIAKFRSYSNFHGAKSGNLLLMDVDKAISSRLSNGEICARSSSASFALFLKCIDAEGCKNKVGNILNALSTAYARDGITFHAGIYFIEPTKTRDGKTTLAKRLTDSDECLSRAIAARHTVDDSNGIALAVYNDNLLEEQLWEHNVEEKMQRALDNKEFKVYIQPKYNPVTGELAGAEALVRWISAEDGFISPGKFIPIFEKNGFITKLDDYMLYHVSRLQSEWIEQGKKIVPISVNVSRAHFANPELAQHISSIVDKFHIPHSAIEIELTESAFFDDKNALLNTIHKLRELGFETSMDDFGAGYSSLNSLKDLPLDVLKLDAEFFRGEDREERSEIVISEAIALAKKLNMRIVAEGVEKKEQVDFLASRGCDMIQGFYFAKPMPSDEYEKRLSDAPEPSEEPEPAPEPAPASAQYTESDEMPGMDTDEMSPIQPLPGMNMGANAAVSTSDDDILSDPDFDSMAMVQPLHGMDLGVTAPDVLPDMGLDDLPSSEDTIEAPATDADFSQDMGFGDMPTPTVEAIEAPATEADFSQDMGFGDTPAPVVEAIEVPAADADFSQDMGFGDMPTPTVEAIEAPAADADFSQDMGLGDMPAPVVEAIEVPAADADFSQDMGFGDMPTPTVEAIEVPAADADFSQDMGLGDMPSPVVEAIEVPVPADDVLPDTGLDDMPAPMVEEIAAIPEVVAEPNE